MAEPELIFRGVPFLDGAGDELLGELREEVERSLSLAAKEGVSEPVLLQQDLHDDLATFIYERLKRRRLVAPSSSLRGDRP